MINAHATPHYYKRNGIWRWAWKIRYIKAPLGLTMRLRAEHHCWKLNEGRRP